MNPFKKELSVSKFVSHGSAMVRDINKKHFSNNSNFIEGK